MYCCVDLFVAARNSFKLYLPTDFTVSLDSAGLTNLSHKQQFFASTKLEFKNNCLAGSGGGGGGGGNSANSHSNSGPTSTTGTQNLCLSTNISPPSAAEQFNIFPAIFSRQLNFSTSGSSNSAGSSVTCSSGGGGGGGGSTNSSSTQNKFMEDLRPNLVGGLLGLQQGLLDDHALVAHGNLQHSSHQESKFMSLQDNRLMGIASHENRLLGLSQDLRSSSINNLDNSKTNVTSSHQNRKCSSTPEDFSVLYGGLSTAGLGDTSSHHHTPAHTPPSRLIDHSITGMYGMYAKRMGRTG